MVKKAGKDKMAFSMEDYKKHLQKNREQFGKSMEEEKQRERKTLERGLVLLINT